MKSATLIMLAMFTLAGTATGVGLFGSTTALSSQKAPTASTITKPTTETVTMRDPVEDCFTVSVPKGWFNQAYSARAYDIHREVVTCVSPNSDTVLFLGDPSTPNYWAPETAHAITYEIARVNPMMKIESYRDAADYFSAYAQRKFSRLLKFKAQSPVEDTELTKSMHEAFAKHGLQIQGRVVNLPFSYEDKGKPMSGLLIGMTINLGQFWIADVWGISTAGKVDDFRPMLISLAKSKQTNPAWTAKQQQRHEAIMAQMRAHQEMMNAQHARNMEWIQLSAQRHQARMEAIWASHDASMKSYWERSASSDMQHRGFLNVINEEHTVVGADGKTFQVTTGYQRYFVNRQTGKYLGGDIRFDADAIRRMGLNPDDYEEMKIRN